MAWVNYHTHSRYCDGSGNLREFIKQALELGMLGLGFSSHAPLPFPTKWTMKPELLDDYCAEVRLLKNEYRDFLPVYLGLEIDYLPGITSPHASRFKSLGLDYMIGSVHYYEQDFNGQYLTVDGSPEELDTAIREFFDGDIRKAVERYYSLICQMTHTDCPDVVGHLDLIKKNNQGGILFKEDDSWYRDAVYETLDAISRSPAILEINTGGLTRNRTNNLYPSPWILKGAFDAGIPLTLNSDAHAPEELIGHFYEAVEILSSVGYKELMVLTPDGWQPRPFTIDGFERL